MKSNCMLANSCWYVFDICRRYFLCVSGSQKLHPLCKVKSNWFSRVWFALNEVSLAATVVGVGYSIPHSTTHMPFHSQWQKYFLTVGEQVTDAVLSVASPLFDVDVRWWLVGCDTGRDLIRQTTLNSQLCHTRLKTEKNKLLFCTYNANADYTHGKLHALTVRSVEHIIHRLLLP